MEKIKVGILGATGAVGQRFAVLLADHPWFEVTALTGSDRTVGQTYAEGCRWVLPVEMPDYVRNLAVLPTEPGMDAQILFSALPADNAREAEPRLAEAGYAVFSNASSHRMWPDVPLLIPEVNHEHIALVEVQRKQRGWKGFVVPLPNCTTTGLAVTLKPLLDRFGVRFVLMTSMQAMSGAGRSPGVIGLDILDNVIPFIPKEEEKVQRETQKILGTLGECGVAPAQFAVSCTCTRVNVLDGHTESVFASLDADVTEAEVAAAMRDYDGGLCALGLPTAPPRFIHVHDDPYRPQPRLDRDMNNGMTTVVGRLRKDAALPNGMKYVLVSHNTKMGAARGAVLTAELLVKQGLIN